MHTNLEGNLLPDTDVPEREVRRLQGIATAVTQDLRQAITTSGNQQYSPRSIVRAVRGAVRELQSELPFNRAIEIDEEGQAYEGYGFGGAVLTSSLHELIRSRALENLTIDSLPPELQAYPAHEFAGITANDGELGSLRREYGQVGGGLNVIRPDSDPLVLDEVDSESSLAIFTEDLLQDSDEVLEESEELESIIELVTDLIREMAESDQDHLAYEDAALFRLCDKNRIQFHIDTDQDARFARLQLRAEGYISDQCYSIVNVPEDYTNRIWRSLTPVQRVLLMRYAFIQNHNTARSSVERSVDSEYLLSAQQRMFDLEDAYLSTMRELVSEIAD